jgi:hypothetical protein
MQRTNSTAKNLFIVLSPLDFRFNGYIIYLNMAKVNIKLLIFLAFVRLGQPMVGKSEKLGQAYR